MSQRTTYATVDEVKAAIGVTDTQKDPRIQAVILAVDEQINGHCERSFLRADTADSPTATARVFTAETTTRVAVDDFYSTTGLVVKTDTTGDGTYDTTWAASDYQAEPLNARQYGLPWSYEDLRAVGNRAFPCSREARVEVTALWGWDDVPAAVVQAAIIQATAVLKGPDSPLGVAGFGDFGPVRIRQAIHPMAQTLLAPYELNRIPVV